MLQQRASPPGGELQVSACLVGACPIGSTFSVRPVGLLQKLLLLFRIISLRALWSLWQIRMSYTPSAPLRASLLVFNLGVICWCHIRKARTRFTYMHSFLRLIVIEQRTQNIEYRSENTIHESQTANHILMVLLIFISRGKLKVFGSFYMGLSHILPD